MAFQRHSAEELSLLAQIRPEKPSMPVRLHPSVILSASRHATRLRQSLRDGTAATALGVLLGHATIDNGVDIVTLFEAVGSEPATQNAPGVDWPAVKRKRERLTEVFPELCVVGWYGLGKTKEDAVRCGSVTHMALCEAFDDATDGTMFALLVDLDPPPEMVTLPVHLFETSLLRDDGVHAEGGEDEKQSGGGTFRSRGDQIVCAVAGMPRVAVWLRKVQFSLEYDGIARVGMDAAMNSNVACGQSSGSGADIVSPQLRHVELSLRLLRYCMGVVVEYLGAVESGRVTRPAPDILRHTAKVCAMLPDNFFLMPPSHAVAAGLFSGVDADGPSALLVGLLLLQTKCTVALTELYRSQKKIIRERGGPV